MKKNVLFVITTLLLVSCSNIPTSIPPPTSPLDNWSTYSNSEYGFSIRYPANLEITPSNNSASIYIGKKINARVGDFNPLDCPGDCPFVENTEPVTIAGLDATRITGYIGSVGGNNPQQYISIIIFRNSLYYTFTLFALDFDSPLIDPSASTIEPLIESDIILFEQILDTVSFSN